MSTNAGRVLSVVVCLALALASVTASAASDYATFDAFYDTRWSIWWAIGVAAAIAAVAATIVFSGGTAAPLVTAAGTWIGSMAGFSGVAATNYGLALLGGGAIAAGGFGMAGGAALLTGVFAFASNIAIDWAAQEALERYNYATFAKQSEKLATLPLPRNDNGSRSFRKAYAKLGSVDPEEALSSPGNSALVRAAIKEISTARDESLSGEQIARNEAMFALLYFVANDYKSAKVHANAAQIIAKDLQGRHGLPAFIAATSSLYEPRVDFKYALDGFRYALRDEPRNKLSPLMFAVFLDRMAYRFHDRALSAKHLRSVVDLVPEIESDKQRQAVYVMLLARYFTQLKLEQQRIKALANSNNETIKNSAKTLLTVRRALAEYDVLVEGARYVSAFVEDVKGGDPAGSEAVDKLRTTAGDYSRGRTELARLVTALAAHQESVRRAAEARAAEEKAAAERAAAEKAAATKAAELKILDVAVGAAMREGNDPPPSQATWWLLAVVLAAVVVWLRRYFGRRSSTRVLADREATETGREAS